ncbi:uncharacterized protein LOC105696111 [Orussus abietinus]|uniref:uncharacterized protein LOC105696111 n=1 Tax=Orussus abietinus TaxID=222816 RepID=UPI0006263223|nr:uncharacterized protein LOC105696111 [Orussus abietinus]
MFVAGTRKLCRVGLAAVLVTALCALALLDLPPQLPDPPTDRPPTRGGEPPGTRSIVAYSWARRLALDYRPSTECAGNGTPSMAVHALDHLVDEPWLETIPGQLFLYSAHLDRRVPGYPGIRVIGVKRGSLRTFTLFCTVWYQEGGLVKSLSMESLIADIWLDEWGGNTITYTGILATCPIPRSILPLKVTISPTPCYENPSHSLIINQKTAHRPNTKRQFTLCIKGLDFEEDVSKKLVAFVELHRILGASFFHFYVLNVHENVLKVLRLYERSNVVRWIRFSLPGDLPNEKNERRSFLEKNPWIKRRMELIPYNHCFYENLQDSEYVLPIDLDETIVPRRCRNWSHLLLDERKRLGKSFKDFASYAVRNAYFFPELQNRSHSTRDADRDLDFDYMDTMRSAIISPEGDSVKSFISTKRALTVHNHYALTTLNPSTKRAHHFDPRDVLKHHHRVCDSKHIDCDLLMEDVRIDRSALRFADELKSRIKTAFDHLNALSM